MVDVLDVIMMLAFAQGLVERLEGNAMSFSSKAMVVSVGQFAFKR